MRLGTKQVHLAIASCQMLPPGDVGLWAVGLWVFFFFFFFFTKWPLFRNISETKTGRRLGALQI